MKWLKEQGADINAKTKKGETPLKLASSFKEQSGKKILPFHLKSSSVY
jgi:ankyrin repeat protein